jgi:hypothetical protein
MMYEKLSIYAVVVIGKDGTEALVGGNVPSSLLPPSRQRGCVPYVTSEKEIANTLYKEAIRFMKEMKIQNTSAIRLMKFDRGEILETEILI